MKHLSLILFSILLLPATIHAEDRVGVATSQEWSTMSPEGKMEYLRGYQDGAFIGTMIPGTSFSNITDLTYLGVIMKIDDFYAATKNKNIGVPFILKAIVAKLDGLSDATVESYLQLIREYPALESAIIMGFIQATNDPHHQQKMLKLWEIANPTIPFPYPNR